MLADKTFHYSYSQIDEHKPAEFCSLALKNSLRLDLGWAILAQQVFMCWQMVWHNSSLMVER